MTVTVIGLGKIGLPLAVQYAMKGEQVFGVDINQKTVDSVNEGLEPFPEEENLKEFLAEVVSSGKLKASTSTRECVSKSDVVVVVVPLFVDDNANPDFTAMDSATVEIAHGIRKGTLVAYETTLPIGTTRNRFTELLEEVSQLRAGVDFYVVFSPERVLTGRIFNDLRRYPKIVGGVSPKCSQKGLEFYERVLDFDARPDLPQPNGVWIMDSSESAEFVKLAETTYRDVNIGLANQFAKYASTIEVDINQVISASNSQIYSHIHQPGISVGGHCIPIYPQFYLWNDPDATVVREARKTNSSMPNYCVSRVVSEVGSLKGKFVAILGATYRAGVKETAFSGVYELNEALTSHHAKVQVHDFILTNEEIQELQLEPAITLQNVEIAIVHHSDLRYIEFLQNRDLFPKLKLIFDGRNVLSAANFSENVRVISL